VIDRRCQESQRTMKTNQNESVDEGYRASRLEIYNQDPLALVFCVQA
jgi:hypothetical protein